MLYKPYGLAGACEDDARFLRVVFPENRDAAKKVMVYIHKKHRSPVVEMERHVLASRKIEVRDSDHLLSVDVEG